MYDAILCPTDGSAGSDAAVEQACDLAELTGARIRAVRRRRGDRGRADEWDLVVDREEERGERALDAVAEAAADRGIEVERHLRRGRPHEEILDAATDGVDLIVMGTHGRTGLGRFVTAGSVAERVVRHSKLPVLTAHIGD